MSDKYNPSSVVTKFGHIGDIDGGGGNEEVWITEGAYTGFVAAAAETTAVSGSTDDDTGGTGAITINVLGLIDNSGSWAEATETVTLDGTTPVVLTNDFIRVYRAYILTAGTGEVNAGNVDIKHGATVLARIGTGYGQTLQACYTIPSVLLDETEISQGNVRRWYGTIGAVSAAYATIALQTKDYGRAWRTRRIAGIGESGWFNEDVDITVSSKADIRVRVLSNGVNNSNISAGFDVVTW